jgi:hypothetical protein
MPSTPYRDAGTELRRALGLPEPNYGPNYKNPHYHGGYRTEEDREDAEAKGQHLWRDDVSDEEIAAERAAHVARAA